MSQSNVFCCAGVSFGYYFHMYSINLALEREAAGVIAPFGTEGLDVLISHCNAPKHTHVQEPEHLAGLLFETKWKGKDSGLVGHELEAIRIHPSYGKEMPWLRIGICLLDKKDRDKIKKYLVMER